MLRTIAAFLLLLGLATVTPVVCLCAPTEAAGLMAGVHQTDPHGDLAPSSYRTAGLGAEASGQNLLATSAAAVVASLIAAAAGFRPLAPWRLPLAQPTSWQPLLVAAPAGFAHPPTPPPPR